MFNKVTALLLAIAAALTIGCTAYARCQSDGDSDFQWIEGVDHPHCYVMYDMETGVEYIVYSDSVVRAVCPRYNADGTLYTYGDQLRTADMPEEE